MELNSSLNVRLMKKKKPPGWFVYEGVLKANLITHGVLYALMKSRYMSVSIIFRMGGFEQRRDTEEIQTLLVFNVTLI